MKNLLTVLIAAIGLFLVSSCQESSSPIEKTSQFPNTTWQNLEGERIAFRVPNELKKSSRHRLREDLPALAEDTAQLKLIQKSLELLEFEDAEVDVYIDTTKQYRLIIICNTQKIDFNKNDVAIIKKELELDNQKSAALNPHLEFGVLEAELKRSKDLVMARYTTPIKDTIARSTIYNSVYYVTAYAYSLVVYEFSEDKELIEEYLWTTKLK